MFAGNLNIHIFNCLIPCLKPNPINTYLWGQAQVVILLKTHHVILMCKFRYSLFSCLSTYIIMLVTLQPKYETPGIVTQHQDTGSRGLAYACELVFLTSYRALDFTVGTKVLFTQVNKI